MPMVDIQRRHTQVFRLRLGDRKGGRPQKLTDAIRVTSPSEAVVRAFTDVFGGDAREWNEESSNDRWEAYLPVNSLPIMVLPGQSLEQWWESWKRSVCERRCDGETEQLSNQPCVCFKRDGGDHTVRLSTEGACRPMTRINVVCPDVAVVGAGSLVSHGMVAAETLPQSIAIAEAALSRGLMVPAVLRVVEHKGKRHYVVPQLEIVGVSLRTLDSGEIPAPALAAAPKAIAAPTPPTTQKKASATQKKTPLTPKKASPTKPPLPGEVEPFPDTPGAVDKSWVTRFAIACREITPEGIDPDAFRHAIVSYATNGRINSAKVVSQGDEAGSVQGTYVAVRDGRARVVVDGDDAWVEGVEASA